MSELKELLDLAKEAKQYFIGQKHIAHNSDALQRTQDGHTIYRIHPSMGGVFVKNGTYNIACNKIYVQNTGNTKVFLFGGWTFLPGEKLFLGAERDYAQTEGQLTIEFDTVSLDPADPTPKNRFEILKFNTNHPDMGFLSSQGKTTRSE